VGISLSPETLEEIKLRADIVDVIGRYVHLKKRGRNYVALCPFHQERTPSFTVSPEKQMFYCFGCGIGGDVFTFLMKYEGLDFAEAAAKLAELTGVDLKNPSSSPAARKIKERLYELGALAAGFYYHILKSQPEGRAAREYLEKRGVKEEAVQAFQLGFSPPEGKALVHHLREKGFSYGEMEQAGLVSLSGKEPQDRFRGRIMFPIKDAQGRVVGFGGRLLGEGQPKYLNSPEGPLFQKGRLLYGLHLALPEIRKREQVVLVEGYMDVIACWQQGIKNAVASLGTSLTDDQAREMKKLAREVIIAYDNDLAGQAATLRGLELLYRRGLQVRVLELPPGTDPDDFLKSQGPGAFQLLLQESLPLMEFCLKRLLSQHDPSHPLGKKAIVEELLPHLEAIKDPVEQEAYVRLVSRRVGVSENAIYRAMASMETRRVHRTPISPPRKPEEGKRQAGSLEMFLLKAYIESPVLADVIDQKLGEKWAEGVAERLIPFIREIRKENPEMAGEGLLDLLKHRGEKEEWKGILAAMAVERDRGPLKEEMVEKAINLFKIKELQKREREVRRTLSRMAEIGPPSLVEALQKEIFQLQVTINKLKCGKGG